MAWRKFGVLLGVMAWATGCGGSSTDGDPGTSSPGAGGSAATGGTSPAGGTGPAGGATVGGSAGQSGVGGATVGGSAGVSVGGSAGASVGGAAGANPVGGSNQGGGGSNSCPTQQPQPGSACSLEGDPPPCAYQQGPSCGPDSSFAVCQCGPQGVWLCTSVEGNPCETCQQPAVAGDACKVDGSSCADACGNACKCSDGVWFCSGQCGGPDDCAPGSKCDQGEACGSEGPGGCTTSCQCNEKGFFDCKIDCANQCPIESAVCGGSCSQFGQACSCFDKEGQKPCSCQSGPGNSLEWVCESAPTGCQSGAVCQPGEGCGSVGPDGCAISCECSKSGTYSCSTSCPGSCPDKPPFCGQSCDGNPMASCQCTAKGGEILPCMCLPDNQGASWQCGDDPPPPVCQPGGFCSPGDACQVAQGDPGCVLSCQCSQGGLYQCKSECNGNSKSCPVETPMPGSKCPESELKCSYGNLTVCFCSPDGTWSCAF